MSRSAAIARGPQGHRRPRFSSILYLSNSQFAFTGTRPAPVGAGYRSFAVSGKWRRPSIAGAPVPDIYGCFPAFERVRSRSQPLLC